MATGYWIATSRLVYDILNDILCKLYYLWSHLSKGQVTSNQNTHSFRHHFWVFNALSLGMIYFFRHVSLRNCFLIGWYSEKPIRNFHFKVWRKSANCEQSGLHHERAWKTVTKRSVGNCVQFVCGHLRLWKDVMTFPFSWIRWFTFLNVWPDKE